MSLRLLLLLVPIGLAIVVPLASPSAVLAQLSPLPSGAATDLDDSPDWDFSIDSEGRPDGCIQAQGRVLSSTDISLTGRALQLDHLGGDCYVGVHFYRNLAAQNSARWFRFGGSYQLPKTTLDNQGAPSLVQNIQWAFSKWQAPWRYECAVQVQIVRDPTPQNAPGNFRVWDGLAWVNTGIRADITGQTWHQLEFDCEITPQGQVKYTRIQADGQERLLSDRYVYSPQEGDGLEDRLSTAVQLDANFRGQPYFVVIDQVNLYWSD